MDVAYVELHCLTNFTFLRGASHPEELIKRALALGYSGLAVTDECSFAGSARAHLALRELCEIDAAAQDFRLIHGTELRLTESGGASGPRLVLLAQNRAGYGNLAQLGARPSKAVTACRARTSNSMPPGLTTRLPCCSPSKDKTAF
jgi:error-prone DNA polymerase